MKNNKKGFTLAELLVVVGIIAVLIAIAIPVFTNQLEKSREAVDAANIRTKYAELMSDMLTGDLNSEGYEVELKQTLTGWSQDFDWPENLEAVATGAKTVGSGVTVTLTPNNADVTQATGVTIDCTLAKATN